MDEVLEFPPAGPGESEGRQQEIQRLDLLGDEETTRWDGLVELAATVGDAAAAWFSIVDGDQLVRVARTGVVEPRVNAKKALCTYTIGSGETLVVDDIDEHPFFSRHQPLADAFRPFRSYCGVAVQGLWCHEIIGTLVVADDKPRGFDQRQKRGMQLLAAQLHKQLRLRGQQLQLEANHRRLQRYASESVEMFRDIRSRAIDLAGALASDAGFIERLATKTEVEQAARDIACSSESITDIVEMAEGYVGWSRGRIKLMASQLEKLIEKKQA